MREETELIVSLLLVVLLVTASATAGVGPDIHDSFEPVPLAEPERPWLPVGAIIGAALIAAAALTSGIVVHRRRARAGPIESAEDRAHRRLAAAATAPGDLKSLYTELNSILIEYVDARGGLPASRRTSVELVQFFERSGVRAELAVFLADCDRAKFSPFPKPGWNRESAIADCRNIIAGISHVAF